MMTWESTHRLWLTRFSGPLHIVPYERLVGDTRSTLHSLLDFLNQTVTEEDMNCALARKEGIYRRRKKYKDFDPFTPHMYADLEIVRRKVDSLIAEYQKSHNQTY